MKNRKEIKEPNKATSFNPDLNKLFMNELRSVLWAEKAFVKAIPKIMKNTSALNLILLLENYDPLKSKQVERLERVFDQTYKSARGKKNNAMEALLKECDAIFSKTIYGPVRDAAIIAQIQKMKHYAMSSYTTLIMLSKMIGEEAFADVFQNTLTELKEADLSLSKAAFSTINFDAAIDENKFLASHYYKGKTI